ncbi:MAG: hypothetical protein ACFFE8_04420 [Candidatus Heimdallarchaeota archaeon]
MGYDSCSTDCSGTRAREEAVREPVKTSFVHDESMIATNHFQFEEMKKSDVQITPANAHTTFKPLEGLVNGMGTNISQLQMIRFNRSFATISTAFVITIVKQERYGPGPEI